MKDVSLYALTTLKNVAHHIDAAVDSLIPWKLDKEELQNVKAYLDEIYGAAVKLSEFASEVYENHSPEELDIPFDEEDDALERIDNDDDDGRDPSDGPFLTQEPEEPDGFCDCPECCE